MNPMYPSSTPNPSPIPKNQCPVLLEAQNALDISIDFRRSLRRLRKKLTLCRDCELEGECEALNAYKARIIAAIDEVAETWVH
jgi:hypothetical protein